MAYLTAISGSGFGKRFELQKNETIMGRHPDCDVTIDVGAVSRQHARIHTLADHFEIEDLKSRNGTFLNGQLLTKRTIIRDGDLVRICDVEFSFHDDVNSLLGSSELQVDGSSFGVLLVDDDQSSVKQRAVQSKLDIRGSTYGGSQLTSSSAARLQAVLEISQNLGRSVKLEEVLPKVLDTLFKIFLQADRAFIVLKEGDDLVPKWIKTRQQSQQETFRISRTVMREVMETKEAIISLDATSDERFEMANSISDFRIKSMIVAPLLDSDGEALGAMQMDTLDSKRHFEKADLEILASIATQAGVAIENAQLHQALVEQHRVEQDLELARQVQQAFLPAGGPNIEGYQFYDFYHPADQIGGDYFDYIHLRDGRLGIVLADVVGHGVAAAMLMAKLSAETRFCLASRGTPAEAISTLNRRMTELKLGRFVTLLCLLLDTDSGETTIVNAGHMLPIWLKSDGTSEEPGDSTAGIPLGIMADYEYKSTTIRLNLGDQLLLYTDGIHEAPSADGKMFGIERLRKLAKVEHSSIAALGDAIVSSVRQFTKGTKQADDMCLVILRRQPTQSL